MTKSSDQDGEKPVATLAPSAFRRGLGVGGMALLGVILAYVAAAGSGSTAATISLAIAAALALAVAYRMKTSTSAALELRQNGLYTSEGVLVAAISNIARVELGIFAFKPSNGFLVVLKKPMPGAWSPGLWWRIGRRVGIGGVTPRAEGKIMAEALTFMAQGPSNRSV